MTKMSKAAMPPIQPHISDEDRKHPQFKDYLIYRAVCSSQLITASSFRDWLHGKLFAQVWDDWVKHPLYPAFLDWMHYLMKEWYPKFSLEKLGRKYDYLDQQIEFWYTPK